MLERGPGWQDECMNNKLNRLRRTLSGLVAEDRPDFKRLDASPALSDDGSWLKR
jgi:hypothetical protein